MPTGPPNSAESSSLLSARGSEAHQAGPAAGTKRDKREEESSHGGRGKGRKERMMANLHGCSTYSPPTPSKKKQRCVSSLFFFTWDV